MTHRTHVARRPRSLEDPILPIITSSSLFCSGHSFLPQTSTKRRRVEPSWFDTYAHEVSCFLQPNSSCNTETRLEELEETPVSIPSLPHQGRVEDIIYAAYSVLRASWRFHGNPQDAFEPTRHLHPRAQQLLTLFGGHEHTRDGQYLIVRGEEAMPWVGFLLVVLWRHLWTPQETPHASIRWRVVMMDCDTFGWGTPTVTEAYVTSQRRFTQIQDALEREITQTHWEGSTLVLLGGCVVMASGATRLAETLHMSCFTAHYAFGHGIAALVCGGKRWDMCGEGKVMHCGERRTREICVHALLLTPMGPLVVHVQRERLRGGEGNAGTAISHAETTTITTTTTTAISNMTHSSPSSIPSSSCGGRKEEVWCPPKASLGELEKEEVQLCAWLHALLTAPQPILLVDWGVQGEGTDAVMELMRRYNTGLDGERVWLGFEECGVGSTPRVRTRELGMTAISARPLPNGRTCQVWCMQMRTR